MAVTIVIYTEAWNIAFKDSKPVLKCQSIKSTYFIPWRKQILRQKERPTVKKSLILLKRYTTFNELIIKNTLVKNKTIFVLMKGFHLPQRQISLQKQPPYVFWKKKVLPESVKLQASVPEKRDSVTGFFMWILWSF